MIAPHSIAWDIRLLIASRHQLLRDGLTCLFHGAGATDLAATDLSHAVSVAEQFWPSVVLCDIGGALATTGEIAELIVTAVPCARLLLLDDTVRANELSQALMRRAAGYWTKRAGFAKIAAAVKAVAAGCKSFCAEVRPHLASPGGDLPPPAVSPLDQLTPRQFDVFMHLVRGLSIQECACRLRLSTHTVDNHKTRLMKKLDLHRMVDLVLLAAHEGLLVNCPASQLPNRPPAA